MINRPERQRVQRTKNKINHPKVKPIKTKRSQFQQERRKRSDELISN